MIELFNFQEFPVIETERLRLREIVQADAEAVFAIRGDYEVTKYNIGQAYTSVERARKLIDSMTGAYKDDNELRWGITLKDNDFVIGMCGYNYWDRTDNRGSIGFDLARAYWRKGIMREALTGIINFGFRNMALNRIEADASIYNDASVMLLRKLGFQQEGHQREQYYEDGTYHDLLLFALLKSEWKVGLDETQIT